MGRIVISQVWSIGDAPWYIYKQDETQQMELISEIVEARNFWEASMSVRRNHGAAGIDKSFPRGQALDLMWQKSKKPFDVQALEKELKVMLLQGTG